MKLGDGLHPVLLLGCKSQEIGGRDAVFVLRGRGGCQKEKEKGEKKAALGNFSVQLSIWITGAEWR